MTGHYHKLQAKSLQIDTYRENIIFMRADCPVCRSEGFSALTRIVVRYKGREIVATLNVVYSELLTHDEAGLSMEALKRLGAADGDLIELRHLKPIESFSKVRGKLYGKELGQTDFDEIIKDIVAGQYANIELAAFVAACSGDRLNLSEVICLTRAMIKSGETISWGEGIVIDKHCIGGLPGNRTTPIVVSIVAAAGLRIPKTSSRAITSPAGTADVMECLTNVSLTAAQIKRTVEQEGGCITWGGSVQLSPADDILISIERPLDIDSAGQLVASVLSKKMAAGSTHVLIDIPVGPTAKVRALSEASNLEILFKAVAATLGIRVDVAITDGSQPIGRGIGPALEAVDVLQVLGRHEARSAALEEKSLRLSAMILEMSGQCAKGNGEGVARELLYSGRAYEKFKAICRAQGGFREPVVGRYMFEVKAERAGTVQAIDNRKLARIAKLAGAPKSPGAGIWFNSPLGKHVGVGDLLYTVYADTGGELEYAKEYLQSLDHLISLA